MGLKHLSFAHTVDWERHDSALCVDFADELADYEDGGLQQLEVGLGAHPLDRSIY